VGYNAVQSIECQETTRHYIPEDSTLHNHCCKNLKSYKSWNTPRSFLDSIHFELTYELLVGIMYWGKQKHLTLPPEYPLIVTYQTQDGD
jgi:hypothetical protein